MELHIDKKILFHVCMFVGIGLILVSGMSGIIGAIGILIILFTGFFIIIGDNDGNYIYLPDKLLAIILVALAMFFSGVTLTMFWLHENEKLLALITGVCTIAITILNGFWISLVMD